MFSKISFFPVTLVMITLLSCVSRKVFPEKYSGEQLHFGQGGGFSGVLNYFALMDDGRLFHRSFQDSTFTLVDTWNKPLVHQVFSNYKTLDLDKVKCYEPGDLYYFIQHRSGDSPFHYIAWGKPGFNPDAKIVAFYNLLYKSTKSKS